MDADLDFALTELQELHRNSLSSSEFESSDISACLLVRSEIFISSFSWISLTLLLLGSDLLLHFRAFSLNDADQFTKDLLSSSSIDGLELLLEHLHVSFSVLYAAPEAADRCEQMFSCSFSVVSTSLHLFNVADPLQLVFLLRHFTSERQTLPLFLSRTSRWSLKLR